MHRLPVAALALVVAMLALAWTPAPAAAAGDEIPTSATTVYTAVPGKRQVRVTVTTTISNRIPSTATTYFFLDSTRIWVEAGAKGLKVTSNGGAVTIKPFKKDTFLRTYDVKYPRILNGQTRVITTTYVLPSGAPRSDSTDRVNTAYLNFWAFSQPMDRASVKIVVPKAFEMETYGGKVTTATTSASKVFSSGWVTDTTKYWLGVSGSNEAGFEEAIVTTKDGRILRVQGWPGDKAWMKTVQGEAESSIEKLVGLIGQPLPGSGPIVIRETAGSELGDAYIASFDEEEQLARVSEDYTQEGTVTHELAHAWFNDSMFDGQWMSEGYASWIERATGTNPHACVPPKGYPAGKDPDIGTWAFADPRATEEELDIVEYQYDAACSIMTTVAGQVGIDRMRDILGVLATTEGAYEGVPDKGSDARVGWKDWLDAVDERGMVPAGRDGVNATGDLLLEYGITTRAALDQRVEARTALATLRETTGWVVPLAVITPMAKWAFDDATAAIDEATAIIETAESVEGVLSTVDAETGPVHDAYEEATDAAALTAVHASVDDQLDAAKAVAGALDSAAVERGFVEQVGLMDIDLDAMASAALLAVTTLDAPNARAKVAELDAAVAQAGDTGMKRIALVAGLSIAVLVLLLVLLRMVMRRRRQPIPAGATGSVPVEVSAMSEPAAAWTPVPADDPTITADAPVLPDAASEESTRPEL